MSDTIYRLMTSCQDLLRTPFTDNPTSPMSARPGFVINRKVSPQRQGAQGRRWGEVSGVFVHGGGRAAEGA
jgi:hypothetical protein